MKLIGITGKSGSGKTTLSRMLEEKDENISVIHMDEIVYMNELKKRLPGKLVDEDTNTNQIGENFLMLSKPIRDIKGVFLKSKTIDKVYKGILKIFREMDLKKRITNAERENKKVVIIEGAMLTKYSIYKDMDYVIQVDAPFIQREERVIIRKDKLLEKNNMVMRDLHFREALQVGKRKGISIDRKIENTGSLEELQNIADDIYIEQIYGKTGDNRKATMEEKYGGYKVKLPIKFNSKNGQAKSNMIDKNDLTK